MAVAVGRGEVEGKVEIVAAHTLSATLINSCIYIQVFFFK